MISDAKRQALSGLALKALVTIEEQYGDDVEMEDAAIVYEVVAPDTEEPETGRPPWPLACNEGVKKSGPGGPLFLKTYGMAGLNCNDRLIREQKFHDKLAEEFDPFLMPPGPLNQLDQAMVDAAGDLDGKRVLDLGCGSGDLTLVLAQAGAKTTGIDLSPGMIDVTRRRVEYFTPEAETRFAAAAAEELPIEDGSIDVIVGRFILHHLDIPRAARECARVLAPGGSALFVENSGRNPLLMFARNHVAGRFGIPRYGTVDERPLSDEDIAMLREQFPHLRLEYPVFDCFTLLDRQILRHRWRSTTRLLRAFDRAIWKWLPAVRAWSFRVLVVSDV